MNTTPKTAGPNSRGKLLYAQSGGVTAVINATAAAVIEACRRHEVTAYAARNGIVCRPGTWVKGEDGRRHICQ